MSKGPLVRQTLAHSAERKKYMDVTEALKREREKDIVAYNTVKMEHLVCGLKQPLLLDLDTRRGIA